MCPVTRRTFALLVAVPLAAAMVASCGAPADPDRCVPPTPSPTGAPWVEFDDGEPCALGEDGTWSEFDDDEDGHRSGPKVRYVPPPRRPIVRVTHRADPTAVRRPIVVQPPSTTSSQRATSARSPRTSR